MLHVVSLIQEKQTTNFTFWKLETLHFDHI